MVSGPPNKLSFLLSPWFLLLLASGELQRQPWVAYSTKEENTARSFGPYPVPNKKDMPYDIMELMEEVERKVKELQDSVSRKCTKPV